jgi:hypothetical protein
MTQPLVERLERWEDFGALVRVEHLSDSYAIVDLCTCTGESVERVEAADPELIAFLRRRPPQPGDSRHPA